jgi:hypothetical protein
MAAMRLAENECVPNPARWFCSITQLGLTNCKENNMSTATISNAKPPRKQLSDQLDRLDSILDGLGDGWNGAVAEAAREGTRLAVRDAIVEIMTDPTLRTKLRQATAPEAPDEPAEAERRPGFWMRMKTYANQAVRSVGRMASNAVTAVKSKVKALGQTAAEAARSIRDLGALKTTALVVGLTVATVSFCAPHAASAALSGISSAVAAVAVRVGVWLGRTGRAMSMA